MGIIGAGLIGEKRALAIREIKKNIITIICDVVEEKAKKLAESVNANYCSDWKKVVEDSSVDAIIVATPNKFQRDIAIAAMSKGKHVLCEKPLGRNFAESKEIYKVSIDKGVVLKTGFNHRHHPAIEKAKRMIDQGELGLIYYIRSYYGHGGRPGYESEWRADKELCGGGELLDQGVHIIDLFRWFLGDFVEVFGKIHTFFWNMNVEDNAFAILETSNKQIGFMHTSWTQWKNKFYFEIVGEKGFFLIEGLGGNYGREKLIIGKRKIKNNYYVGGPPELKIEIFDEKDSSWKKEILEFFSAIEEKREPLGSGYDGMMANKIIESLYISAKENRPVRLS